MPAVTLHPSQLDRDQSRVYREAFNRQPLADADRPVAQTLADAGLLSLDEWNGKVSCHPVQVHPAYTDLLATPGQTGVGDLHIDVSLLDPRVWPRIVSVGGHLLASFHGAELYPDRTEPGGVLWRLSVVHPDATDIEHDRVILAALEIANLQPSSVGTTSCYHGWLASARMWPHGTDPTTCGDGNGPAETCDLPDHPAHPIAAYHPPSRPEIDALSGPVQLEVTSTALVDVHGRRLDRTVPGHDR